MGLAFLPWERLPAWLLGPLILAAGIFLVLHSESYSWRQFEAVGFIVVGIGVFIHGIKKLRAKSVAEATSDGK